MQVISVKRNAGVFKFLRFEERFGKLRFRDGLVWTVGLTVEIKLHFQIYPAYYRQGFKTWYVEWKSGNR